MDRGKARIASECASKVHGLYWSLRGLSWRGSRGGEAGQEQGWGAGGRLSPYLSPILTLDHCPPHPAQPSQRCLFVASYTGRDGGGQRPNAVEGQTQPGQIDSMLAPHLGLPQSFQAD